MKIAAAVLVLVSTSLVACAPAPDEPTSVASEFVASGLRSTTECQLRYEYKDCAGTICQRFVDQLELTSDTYPSFERRLGEESDPYTATVWAMPKRTPTGDSPTEGYFELAVNDTKTGLRYAASSQVSLSDLGSKTELLAGELRLNVAPFDDHGRRYDYVELICLTRRSG